MISWLALLAFQFPCVEAAQRSQIKVHDPWVRKVLQGVSHTAAYLTLENPTDQAIRLVGASTPLAKTVEIHTHIERGGSMKMEKLEAIDIPSHGKTELQPKGLHLMILFIRSGFLSAKRVPIALKFSDGSIQKVSAEIRDFDSPHHHHEHSMEPSK
jgi:copper(I)-binding protein